MEDWKTRLANEYRQTKDRYEKLKAYNNKCEVDEHLAVCRPTSDIEEARRKDVDSIFRREQQKIMCEYLHILELRMELYGITI